MDIDLKSFFESSDNTLKNITRKSKEVSSVNTATDSMIQEERSSDVQPYHPDDYTQIEEKGDDKLYPVYINLFSNNTAAGKFIKKMTGTPYSHATVALDASMNNMYSFSALPYTKGVLGGDVSIGRESLWSPWYTSCEFFTVLVTFVDKEGRDAVQKKIDNFVRNVDKFEYNTLGCIEYYFGVKNLKDHDETTKNKWFCSEFVAACINSAGVPGFENIYMSPDDLSKSPNVISLGKYTLDSFDEKDLIKKTKKAEAEFRKKRTLDMKLEYGPMNESVVDHIRRMKSDEVNTSKHDRCTAFVDWKKLYEEFRKVFPRTNPSLRFPLFELIIDKTVRPAKVTGDKVTSMIVSELHRIRNAVKEGFIQLIDIVKSLIMFNNQGEDIALHYPDDTVVTETVDPPHTEEPVNSMPEQTTSSEHSFLSNEDSDLDNLASMFEDAIAGLKDVYDAKENPTQTPANPTADESAGVMEFLPSVEPQREILTKDQAFENLETSYESLFEFKNEEANETLDVSTTPFAPKTLFITTESYHYPDIVHELVEDVLTDIESGNPDYADKKSLVWRMTGENVVPLAAIAEDLGFVQIESIDPTSEVTTYAMDISQYTPEKPSYMSEAARDVSNIFRADDEYIYLNVPYCEFYIPTEYFAMGKKFAEDFTDKINVIGLFNIGLFENDKLVDVKVFNVPVYLDINVYDFDVRMIDVGSGNTVECRVYKYYKDAIICRSFIPENSSVAQTFLQLIISGSMPGTIPYSQCLSVWRKNLELSGVSLGVSSAVMEMILAVMYRDAKDPSKKYCIRYGSSADSSEYDYMSASIRQICQYNSTFTGIIYEDIDSMITSAINRNRNGKEEGETPMEKIIKM
nr:MAG TPA: cysteine peptidase [Caudoviricetes sp.]